ncbi:MAG: ABC transporter ATP-binding protein [Clostridiaceae bacterium]|nr:ABC transporter ATP-binding protein [Clostridiaceae bacterium]
MKSMRYYLKPHFMKISIQFSIKFFGTITDLLLPWLLSYIIDDIAPTNNINNVYFFGGIMIACAAVALICNVTANRMAVSISCTIIEKIRHELFEKVCYLSNSQTDDITTPSLVSRLTSDTYNMHRMLDRIQRIGVRAPILLLGGIAVTLTLEPVLTLVLLGAMPLLTIIVVFISRKGTLLYTKTQQSVDLLVRKIQENFTGVRVIKALSKTEYEKERFEQINSELAKNEQYAGVIMATTNPVMNLLLNTGLVLVVIIGAYRVNSGVTQPGKIIAFLSYFTIILNALLMVTRLFVMYSKGAASSKRVMKVLNAPKQMRVEHVEPKRTDTHIEFRNVDYSYNNVKNNLTDISFSLKHGETLGIIGPTGSGKSTIINLLLRFYDVNSGQILISGKDVKSIPFEQLYNKFGVAFQNDFLMADTIFENIDFGRSLDSNAIEHAAKIAQVDFIKSDKDFTKRLVPRGENLSGGQKQRLLIARALAAKPEILILDDSSSALDYLTDSALRNALNRDFGDTTKIIVAQRVSSVINAEKIILLDNGKIVGAGTHEQLLSENTQYHNIYQTQMGDWG